MSKWVVVSSRGDFARGKILTSRGTCIADHSVRGHFDFTLCLDRATKYASEEAAKEAITLLGEEEEGLCAIPLPATEDVVVKCSGVPLLYFCCECGKSGVKLWRKRGTAPTKDHWCWRCLGAVSKTPKMTHRIGEVFYDCDISAREVSDVSRFIRLLWWKSLPL